jgi:hypothetical protein
MTRTRRGFCIALAVPLGINLVMLALLGEDCDSNLFWILLNLPGMPCGIIAVVLAPSEYAGLGITILGSCIACGAIRTGIAKLTEKARSDGDPAA